MRAFALRKHLRFHYAWVVVAVTFMVMLITAGTRAAPSVMLVPLQRAFGWDLASISGALSVNLALFGFMGPFAAATMQRFGLRRTVLGALIILAAAVAWSGVMQHSWQMWLIWGLIVGSATAMILGAVVVSRWFTARRGLAMGLLTASSATGQLVFLPLLAYIVEHGDGALSSGPWQVARRSSFPWCISSCPSNRRPWGCGATEKPTTLVSRLRRPRPTPFPWLLVPSATL